MMKPSSFSATVISNTYIAQETRSTIFRISKLEQEDFSFSTGQFLNLKCPQQENEKFPPMRAYSIASSSSLLPEFELCVKVVEKGRGSGYIDAMKQGDEVHFMGPFGHFGTSQPQKKLLMVATGTGIAPMKAIVEEQKDGGFTRDVTLVFGVREEKFASYHQLFTDIAEEFENFSFFLYVSRPEDDSFCGYEGRVTEYINAMEENEHEDTEVIICGNPEMVKQVKNILIEEKGFSKDDIVIEAY